MQQRRLAEFATMLGDFKLAVAVWEALRKETKGASGSVSEVVHTMKCLFHEFAMWYEGDPSTATIPVTGSSAACIKCNFCAALGVRRVICNSASSLYCVRGPVGIGNCEVRLPEQQHGRREVAHLGGRKCEFHTCLRRSSSTDGSVEGRRVSFCVVACARSSS